MEGKAFIMTYVLKPDDDCAAEHLLDDHHDVLKYYSRNCYCQLFCNKL